MQELSLIIKEIIFPFPLFIWTRTNVAHIDIMIPEDIQYIDQCPGFVGGAEEYDRFIIAAGQRILLADDQKPCDVIGNIFNVLAQQL